jgi:hypothetical protein
MKRSVLFLISVFILTSAFSINISAASKQDIIDAAKLQIPAGYGSLYMIQLENVLMQAELTPEQCERIIEIIDELKIADDSGHTPDKYVNEFCKAAGLTYKYRPANTGDAVLEIYDPDGDLLGEFDSRDIPPVKKTGSAALPAMSIMLPAAAAGIMAIAVFIYIKNKRAVNT